MRHRRKRKLDRGDKEAMIGVGCWGGLWFLCIIIASDTSLLPQGVREWLLDEDNEGVFYGICGIPGALIGGGIVYLIRFVRRRFGKATAKK